MTERTSHGDYIPGLGRHFLTPLYDVVHHVFGLQPVHQEMIDLAALRDGHRVLDIGCATANLLRTIGRQRPGVALVGLDPDPKALARARRKARRAGLDMRLDRGFAQELPYPDGSFDRVFSSLMLHHLEDTAKDQLLAEARRVLRPDGLLIVADLVVDEHGHHGSRRMRARLHDNVGDAVSRRVAAAGFTVEPTRTTTLGRRTAIGIELGRVS
ncbi:class I SAM-dependent methyltransferase [Actinophytocola sp.]|uniref:class I SAM-dependent methyltransferase n=1 Tax=Actinophytocola sp. TaxID=1872138 RepID=UPI002D598563|nr:class I SAM-dependent methyltransferase [Actinophytocola sp.]HYQ69443.1 class I SAM-dependent methyltransferase [Actinophytocola sp.]